MYITINNIKGEKRIDLSYSIQNFDSGKKVAVIRMSSDNVKYEILKLGAVMDPISNTKNMFPSRTYAGRELLSMLEGVVELNKFLVDDRVIKKNKLKGITQMSLNYGRYQDLIEKYRRSVNAMVSDSFPGQFLFNM